MVDDYDAIEREKARQRNRAALPWQYETLLWLAIVAVLAFGGWLAYLGHKYGVKP